MSAKDKNLNDLFLDTLKDIYYAEKQILRALPKMAKAAQSKDLRAAFEKHHGETEGHVERLEQVFELLQDETAVEIRVEHLGVGKSLACCRDGRQRTRWPSADFFSPEQQYRSSPTP